MASKTIEKDVEEWLESDVETALIELQAVEDGKVEFVIGEDEQKFSLSFSDNYPKTKEFFFFSEDSALSGWLQNMNEYVEKKSSASLSDVLTEAAEQYLQLFEEDGDNEDMEEEEDILPFESKPTKTKKSKEEQEIDNKEFLEIGSASATMRLIKDLKAIHAGNSKELGFTATPQIEPKSGMENLYHWDVKLINFDKDSDLYKDMEKYRKSSGQDYILLELRFSKDYPFAPPFVRVVRPRFQFRTGHVTIGGSICMELLTNSGWNSTNDIESILIQIRAELLSGGARLDHSVSNKYEYSESEAWDAFYRAARSHGWNVDKLSKDMFPKV